MKQTSVIALGAWLLLAGTAFTLPASAQPAMPYPPVPELRPEAVPPPPGARYAWEPGHWFWNGRTYVWVGGRYIVRQPHYAQYVPGHWQWAPHRGGWIWRPAHWG